MKKYLLLLLCTLLLCSHAFAIGPVPISLWLGAGGGNFGLDGVAGADIGISIPAIPTFYIEGESSGMLFPLGMANLTASVNRLGVGFKFNIIGDAVRLRLSAGSATVNASNITSWGNGVIERNNQGTYISIGPEFSLLGFGAILKGTFTKIDAGMISEVNLSMLASF
jgi:hypothetical protein